MQEKLNLCWTNALQDINVFQAVEKNEAYIVLEWLVLVVHVI